jgi:DNA-binding GntR family transcriptional regulator
VIFRDVDDALEARDGAEAARFMREHERFTSTLAASQRRTPD